MISIDYFTDLMTVLQSLMETNVGLYIISMISYLYLSVYLSLSLSVSVSVCLRLCLSLCLSLSVCPSPSLSISVSLRLCLSLCLSLFRHFLLVKLCNVFSHVLKYSQDKVCSCTCYKHAYTCTYMYTVCT